MSYGECKNCGEYCSLEYHHCDEWEVWLDEDTREDADKQWADNAEDAAVKWGEWRDDEHNWVDSPNVVCVARPGIEEVKRFEVVAEISIDYSASEVSE